MFYLETGRFVFRLLQGNTNQSEGQDLGKMPRLASQLDRWYTDKQRQLEIGSRAISGHKQTLGTPESVDIR